MARVSYKARSVFETSEYDALLNLSTRNCGEEFRPEGKLIANFLNSGNAFSDNNSPEREGNKSYSDYSESLLSQSARGKCKREDSIRIDANLQNLLNASEAKTCDQKPTDFSDFLATTFNENSNMKLKDNTVGEPKFDLFSDFIQDHDPSARNCYNRLISPACDVSLSDITIPEIPQAESLIVQSDKNVNSSVESEFSLSDILSSICIDDGNQSASKESSRLDQTLCLDDFNIGEVNVKLNAAKTDATIDITPNSFMSFDFSDEALFAKTPSDKILNDNVKYSGSLNSNDGFSFEISSNEHKISDCINIQDLLEDANMQNVNSLGTSLDSTKSTGFSFFCDPSENQLTFSEMLEDDNRSANKPHRSDSSSDQGSISMLDLYNSIQASSFASESNSCSNSDEIERKGNDGSTWLSSTSEEDDEQDIVAIDLSTCIKSLEDKTNFKLLLQTTETDLSDQNRQSPSEDMFHDTPKLCLPLRNIANTQASRINLRQSLFAKALSCKSKKDPVLIHKVANVKAELFNEVFGRSLPLKNNMNEPHVEVATYSSKSINQCNERRKFGA